MNTERVRVRSYFKTTLYSCFFTFGQFLEIAGDRVTPTHFTNEDPDEPKSTCEKNHEAVEEELAETVTPAFDNEHQVPPKIKKKDEMNRNYGY